MHTCAVVYHVRAPTLPRPDSGNVERHFLPKGSQETTYKLFLFLYLSTGRPP